MLAWLPVWSYVQTCIWPSWCHCHSPSLASVKSRLVLPFWYRLTRVVLEKGPLNGCVCVLAYPDYPGKKRPLNRCRSSSSSSNYYHHHHPSIWNAANMFISYQCFKCKNVCFAAEAWCTAPAFLLAQIMNITAQSQASLNHSIILLSLNQATATENTVGSTQHNQYCCGTLIRTRCRAGHSCWVLARDHQWTTQDLRNTVPQSCLWCTAACCDRQL